MSLIWTVPFQTRAPSRWKDPRLDMEMSVMLKSGVQLDSVQMLKAGLV